LDPFIKSNYSSVYVNLGAIILSVKPGQTMTHFISVAFGENTKASTANTPCVEGNIDEAAEEMER
jgi:hypothetical protein